MPVDKTCGGNPDCSRHTTLTLSPLLPNIVSSTEPATGEAASHVDSHILGYKKVGEGES